MTLFFVYFSQMWQFENEFQQKTKVAFAVSSFRRRQKTSVSRFHRPRHSQPERRNNVPSHYCSPLLWKHKDRLHLSDTTTQKKKKKLRDDVVSCKDGDGRCTGALKQMLSTINPFLIMLTLDEINLLRPAYSRSSLVMKCCNLLPQKKIACLHLF